MAFSVQPLVFRLLAGVCLVVGMAAQAAPSADATAAVTTKSSVSLLERYSNLAQEVLLKGLEKVGIGYRSGGAGANASGLDCSGFVQTVYNEAVGLMLPRTAREQAKQGQKVAPADLKPGDLVFFNTMRRAFSHVGIYLGDHYFLHSPSAGGTVRLESMQNRYWVQRYNGARRILAD
ncbi:MAG: C40 family peptidase [Zoogloeaceae bacterium]|nr:C40 family peptidase [Zoogloeaceae bacterium]